MIVSSQISGSKLQRAIIADRNLSSTGLESGNATGAFLQTPAPILQKYSGPIGAGILSSFGLQFGTLLDRAQFVLVVALDKNWSPISENIRWRMSRAKRKNPKAKKSHEQYQRIFWTIRGQKTQQNMGFEANRTRKFTRKFGKIFVAQLLWGTFSVPENAGCPKLNHWGKWAETFVSPEEFCQRVSTVQETKLWYIIYCIHLAPDHLTLSQFSRHPGPRRLGFEFSSFLHHFIGETLVWSPDPLLYRTWIAAYNPQLPLQVKGCTANLYQPFQNHCIIIPIRPPTTTSDDFPSDSGWEKWILTKETWFPLITKWESWKLQWEQFSRQQGSLE